MYPADNNNKSDIKKSTSKYCVKECEKKYFTLLRVQGYNK